MKKIALALVAAGAAVCGTPAAAQINAPVPTANYITYGGNDWAWAGPCSAFQPSCGVIDMSYQSTQGWRIAQAADFAGGPTAADFGTSSNFACASAWFNTVYTHCDYSDAVSFHIYNHPLNGGNGATTLETWVIRDGFGGGVPEPSAWALLILGFGMVGAGLRRRVAGKHAFA